MDKSYVRELTARADSGADRREVAAFLRLGNRMCLRIQVLLEPISQCIQFGLQSIPSPVQTPVSSTPRLCNYRIGDTFSGTRYSYLKYVVRPRLTYTALHSIKPIAHATFSPTAVRFPAARQLLLYWYQCRGTETLLGEVAPG